MNKQPRGYDTPEIRDDVEARLTHWFDMSMGVQAAVAALSGFADVLIEAMMDMEEAMEEWRKAQRLLRKGEEDDDEAA